jgi:hypothetical protein
MKSPNFGGCFAHYLLQSCPVSLPARVSLSAQATDPGILAEIATRVPQSSAAANCLACLSGASDLASLPVRVSVGLANVHSVDLCFSLHIVLCAIFQP